MPRGGGNTVWNTLIPLCEKPGVILGFLSLNDNLDPLASLQTFVFPQTIEGAEQVFLKLMHSHHSGKMRDGLPGPYLNNLDAHRLDHRRLTLEDNFLKLNRPGFSGE